MFRLIAQNSLSGIRPVLLRNVRGNTNSFLLLGPQYGADNTEPCNQVRPLTTPKVERYLQQRTKDLFLRELTPQVGTLAKLNRFEELLITAAQLSPSTPRGHKQYFDAVTWLSEMFNDSSVKDNVSRRNLVDYVRLLGTSIYKNRMSRLGENRNRDSDQYKNVTLNNDIMLKSAILSLASDITDGHFKKIIDYQVLRHLFLAMFQYQLHSEMLALWESGVNDDAVRRSYLDQEVLAFVLGVAYSSGRFTYDEVILFFELTTKDAHAIDSDLLACMGKIAIQAGDNSKALDFLEALLSLLERQNLRDASQGRMSKRTKSLKHIHLSLSELHLTFLGSCKDINIATHFFNKAFDNDLPYIVNLKAPHVVSLFENCLLAGEPFDTILDVWKKTLKFYTAQDQHSGKVMNSRFTVLNKGLFPIFFRIYPTLTEESYAKLKEIIAICAEVKNVDEFFLNNIINSYTWNNKEVLEQLIENYSIHHVQRSPVAYRVCLKKTGEVGLYTNEEILKKWNESLEFLELQNFHYIPIADWAALRDATILSPYSEDRSQFYLQVLNVYKNYHQDDRACIRFAKYWLARPLHMKEVGSVSIVDLPNSKSEVEITKPNFHHLTENVDYSLVTYPLFKEAIDKLNASN